ncbi:hypothetical protein ACS0TY_002179 [Phlomoides rotata]
MTIMRVISRLILRKSSQPSHPRWLSTSTEAATVAETEAPPQPSKQMLRKLLFNEVVENNSGSNIRGILDKWVNEGKQVKKVYIGNLLHYFRNRKNFHAALQLYEWIDSSNLEMSDADRAIRIDLLCKTEGLASAEKYFNSLQVSEKTNKTYGALLNCYCREKVLDKALDLFDKMKELNFISTLNYNYVLSLFHSTEQPEKVVSLLQEMEEKNIAPDRRTYNLLISSYAALNHLDATEIVEKMKSSNIKPDFSMYEKLATVYIDSGLHDKANAVLELIEQMEIQNDEGALEGRHTRLKLYSMMNDLSGINRVWEGIKSASPTPSTSSYLAMLLALSKLGDKENLEKIFKEWEESRLTHDFDFWLPNVLLDFHLRHNMIEEANFLYKSLEHRASEANLKALNLFANLCIKNSQIDLALNYLEMGLEKAKPREKQFPTDETMKLFVDYFEASNDRDRGEKFIQSMTRRHRLSSDSLPFCSKAPEAET